MRHQYGDEPAQRGDVDHRRVSTDGAVVDDRDQCAEEDTDADVEDVLLQEPVGVESERLLHRLRGPPHQQRAERDEAQHRGEQDPVELAQRRLAVERAFAQGLPASYGDRRRTRCGPVAHSAPSRRRTTGSAGGSAPTVVELAGGEDFDGCAGATWGPIFGSVVGGAPVGNAALWCSTPKTASHTLRTAGAATTPPWPPLSTMITVTK